MMIYKYFGIILLSATVSMYGAYLSSRIKQKNQLRSEIIDFICHIEKSIRYEKKPISDIYKSFKPIHLSQCGFYTGLNEGQDVKALVNKHLYFLTNEEKQRIEYFFINIGKSKSAEAEMALCNASESFLKDIFDKTKKDDLSKSILYKKLGLIIGLVLAILLI